MYMLHLRVGGYGEVCILNPPYHLTRMSTLGNSPQPWHMVIHNYFMCNANNFQMLTFYNAAFEMARTLTAGL